LIEEVHDLVVLGALLQRLGQKLLSVSRRVGAHEGVGGAGKVGVTIGADLDRAGEERRDQGKESSQQ
jgi:hypothetical protein